ncbi:alpha/beta fold hydrolase [Longispora albida]|uniref:alpha/beta fold hydrolase n=1 Tax=Longispora albida TaxID=203523 RepID=UPI00036F1152|nr:alpha/beta hydrolase [Longispora albida]
MTTTAFTTAYDAVLRQWPAAPEELDVPTRYGSTRVLATGPAGGPPVVLLHGGGSTATVWYSTVASLGGCRVYAPDIIGSGRSTLSGQPLRTRADLMAWLDELLDALGVPAAGLAGHSYGGWVALSYAQHAPARVSRLALIDPSTCFTGFRPGYLLHALPMMLRPSPERVRGFLTWETGGRELGAAWAEVYALGHQVPDQKIVMPKQPKPADLAAVTMPVLIFLAGQTRSHDITKLAAAARRALPQASIETLPDATHHTLPQDGPAGFHAALGSFLCGPPA